MWGSAIRRRVPRPDTKLGTRCLPMCGIDPRPQNAGLVTRSVNAKGRSVAGNLRRAPMGRRSTLSGSLGTHSPQKCSGPLLSSVQTRSNLASRSSVKQTRIIHQRWFFQEELLTYRITVYQNGRLGAGYRDWLLDACSFYCV